MTFASNPPSALVSFSGMGVCYTPCVTKLEPQRRYKVKMTLDGYADWTGEIVNRCRTWKTSDGCR